MDSPHELDLLMDNPQAYEVLSGVQPALIYCLACIVVGSLVFALIQSGAPAIPNSLLSNLIEAQTEYLRLLLRPLRQEVFDALSEDVLKALHTYLSQVDEVNGRIVEIAIGIPSFNTATPIFRSLNEAIVHTDFTLSTLFDTLDAAGLFNGSVMSM